MKSSDQGIADMWDTQNGKSYVDVESRKKRESSRSNSQTRNCQQAPKLKKNTDLHIQEAQQTASRIKIHMRVQAHACMHIHTHAHTL